MPIMPNGTFQNIDEVRGGLRFLDTVMGEMRNICKDYDMSDHAKAKMSDMQDEADMLRRIVADYEERVAG